MIGYSIFYCSHLIFTCSNEPNSEPDYVPLNFRRYRKTPNALFSSVFFKKTLFMSCFFIPSESLTDVFGKFHASYTSLHFIKNQIFPANVNLIYLTYYIATHILKSKTLKLPCCRVLRPPFRHLLNVKIFHSALCFSLPSSLVFLS
jgi:hypothetical protein